jgi:diguanylate cyclase (GGDEF)-like protein
MVFRFETVRTRLGWIVFAPLLLVVVAGSAGVWSLVTNLTRENSLSFQEEILSLQGTFIENWLSERRSDTARLADELERELGDPAAMLETLEQFRAQERAFSGANFRRPDGVTGLPGAGGGGIDISDREYFKRALNGNVAISEVLISRRTDNPNILVAQPVRSAEEDVVGVVFGAVPLATLTDLIESVRVSPDSESYLLNEQGTFITSARYEPRLRAQGQLEGDAQLSLQVDTEIYRRAIKQQPEIGTYTSYWGGRVLGSYRWVNDNRWILVYEQPWRSVIERYEETLRVAAFVAFVLAVGLVFVIRRVEFTITDPIHRLSEAAQSYFSDTPSINIDAREYRRAPVEIRQLADTFQAMWQRVETDIHRIEESSRRDGLTGLYKREFFEEESNRLVQFCGRSELPVAMLVIDIDYFKRINDTHGHGAGDSALHAVAQRMERVVRESDVLCRYGGEEFAVFIPNATAEQGRELGERLRRNIESGPVYVGDLEINVTVSVGVDSCGPAEQTDTPGQEIVATLIARADRALYTAKEAGRNRVFVAQVS